MAPVRDRFALCAGWKARAPGEPLPLRYALKESAQRKSFSPHVFLALERARLERGGAAGVEIVVFAALAQKAGGDF